MICLLKWGVYMGYILTGIGVLLRGVLSAVLSITGETYTSGAVTRVVNIIMAAFIIAGVIRTIKDEKYGSSSDLIKALLIHAVIIVAGFVAVKVIALGLMWFFFICLIAACVLFVVLGLW